jgi:hypothetical protein
MASFLIGYIVSATHGWSATGSGNALPEGTFSERYPKISTAFLTPAAVPRNQSAAALR